MRRVRAWGQRLTDIVYRHQRDREFDAELESHLQLHSDENIRLGMSPAEARRAAMLKLGGLEKVRAEYRDARGFRWLDDVAQDLRFTLRVLGRQRSLTLVATMILALGVAVNGIFFTLVDMICLRGLPLVEVHRVMYIDTRDVEGQRQGMSYRDFVDVRASQRTMTDVAAFRPAPVTISEDTRAPQRFTGAYVSAGMFPLLGEAPVLGRDFRPDDDRIGAPAVVLLGHAVWQQRYGGDRSVVGQPVRVNGTPARVIGVMPDGFKFPTNSDVWQPLSAIPDLTSQGRGVRPFGAVGRLVDGASELEAQGDMNAIAGRLARRFPDSNHDTRFVAMPINDRYNADVTDAAWLAFITAGVLVLLVACANVANLLLMRATQRSGEIAMRASLGATRWRVIRQLLVESSVLTLLGGCIGVGLAVAGLRVLSTMVPTDTLPFWWDFSLNGRILAILTASCLGTGLMFGLVPAFYLSNVDLLSALKEGGPRQRQRLHMRRLRVAFLVGQVTVALLLAANLSLGTRAALVEARNDPGIEMSQLLTASIALPPQVYRTARARATFYDRLSRRVNSLSAVASMTLATALPFGGASPRQLEVEGQPVPSTRRPTVWTVGVGERYFETLGLTVIRGRAFEDRDGTDGHAVAIVNDLFARTYFPETDPIRRRIALHTDNETEKPELLTIVGISPTVRQRLEVDPDPVVYLPQRVDPPAAAVLVVRGTSGVRALSPLLREEVRRLDPDLPVFGVRSMEGAVNDLRWNARLSTTLLTMITLIAIGFAAVGIYAVTSHRVALRTPELGVHIAVGARARHVMWLVLRPTLTQVGVGLGLGVLSTLAWERLFASSAGALRLSDPITLSGAAALLAAVTTIACLWPIRRSTHLDPVVALRGH